MNEDAAPKNKTPLPYAVTMLSTSSNTIYGYIEKKSLDPAIFAHYDAKIALLEKLVGQLYFPHNPHV